MKLLLIIPNIEGKIGSPPYNLALLKAFINQSTKHEAHVADLSFHKTDWKAYLSGKIRDDRFDLIGISVLTFNLAQALQIAAFIKSISDIKIITGGVHAILMPESLISNRNIDIVCIGEGEYPLKEIMDNGLDCTGIRGIWYKVKEDTVRNEPRRLLEDLDELPFADWDDFRLEKYFLFNNNHITLMSTRGCPYECSYCNNHSLKNTLNGTYVRFRSVDSVLDEVGALIDKYHIHGLRYIYFIDDIFIMKRDWILEFCKKYVERGYARRIKWTASVRANLVKKDIIQAMKNAGCYQVGMGIEAANDYIRNDVYNRNITREQIESAVRIIKQSGMLLSTQFIIGAPFETIEMMEESLKLAKKIDPDTVMFSILMPLPKTNIRRLCENEGLIEDDNLANDQIMYSIPVIKSKHADLGKIRRVYQKVRNYQIKKYITEGLRLRGFVFLKDLILFFSYYMPRYRLEIQNAFKFTVKRYVLENLERKTLGNAGC